MPVQYDSKKIIPAPFASIEKTYIRSGDTNKVGSTFTITLTGRIVTCGGSPNSVGEFFSDSGYPDSSFQDDSTDGQLLTVEQRQAFLQRKTQAIRHLFSNDGKSFELQPFDGSAPIKCYPRVNSISFQEGVWVDYIPYTIVLEADELYGINNEFIKDAEDFNSEQDFFKDADGVKLYLTEANESWQLETVDGEPENLDNLYTYRLTHNISATGRKVYNDGGLISAGWEQAKRWVKTRLGIDNVFVNDTIALKLTSKTGYNHVRTENTDELTGQYSVTETWIIASGNCREDFTVDTQYSLESGLTRVVINGEIIGFDTKNSTTMQISETKYQAASVKYANISSGVTPTIFTRAQTYSGITLNTQVLSTSVGKNPLVGRINYSFEYDNRPSNCISNALTESIVITDKNPTDIFANIPVIGRTNGPVLQDMGTTTERTRTVNIDVNVLPVSICPTNKTLVASLMSASPASEVENIINAFEDDLEDNYEKVFRSEDNPSWTPKTGRYSRTVTWTFGSCN